MSFVQLPTDGTGKKVRTSTIAGEEQQILSRAKSDGTLLDDEATETTLALIKAKTDNLNLATTALRDAIVGIGPKTLTDIVTALANLSNLDAALSTRTKPGDQQHVIVDTMTPALALDATVAARTKPSDQQHVIVDTMTPALALDATVAARTKPSDQQHVLIDSQPIGVSGFPADQLVHANALDANLSTIAKDATLTTLDTDLKATQPRRIQAPGNAIDPVLTEGVTADLSQTLSGRLRVDIEATSPDLDGVTGVYVNDRFARRLQEQLTLEAYEQSFRNLLTSESFNSERRSYEVR